MVRRIKFISNISVQVFVILLKIQMQANHLKINMRYNQHCVLLLITFILLIYHLQQVTIFSKISSEDEILRTGKRVLLKNRMNSKQFRIRTNALKKVVDAIAGRQPNFRSKKLRPTSIKSSNTLVYNRIDKAGSTTLISLFRFLKKTSSLFSCFKRLWRKYPTRTHFTLWAREIQISDTLTLAKRRILLKLSAKKTVMLSTLDTSTIQTLLSQDVM